MEYLRVLWWLVAYLGLMMVGMPLVAALFPRLADRGASLALPAALAVVWVLVYLFGHFSLSWVVYLGGFAVLFLAAFALVFRDVEFDLRQYSEAAVVFAVAFLFMVAIRSVDAGVHPVMGEKFLDFGMLKSILRADALPPEDMWFAGRPVKYYYGGHLVAAILTKLTGTDPRFGYNFALAGFYGMVVTAAYGLAGSIAASRDVSRVRAGLFGAFFVAFASNLHTAGQALDKGLGWLTASGRDQFWYWRASRVIDGTINEFPLFAWLNGDMHAHMMSMPFLLLAAGILFSYYQTPEAELTRRRVLAFGVLPPLAGLLGVVNTWSFPTVGGLAFLAFALAPTDPLTLLSGGTDDDSGDDPVRRETAQHAWALAGALAVVALALVWTAPFWLGPAQGGSQRSPGFFPDQSSMGSLLAVHGAFVVLFGLHLVRHTIPYLDDDHVEQVLVLLGVGVFLAWGGASSPALAVLGPMIVVGWVLLRLQVTRTEDATATAADAARGVVSDGGATSDAATPEGSASAGGGATTTPETGSSDRLRETLGFETVLLIAGAGIVVLAEFVYVKEQAGPGRLNTVFKTYADVWVLWAVAAGAIVAHLVENHSPSLGMSGGGWRRAFQVLAVVLVVSTSVYGAAALNNHFQVTSEPYYNANAHPDGPTLDGLNYVEQERPNEYQAILWFDDLEGQPNVVEAAGTDMYKWTNPISSLTGVPTLAGWSHEFGYRGGDVYYSRVDDVETIYSGSPRERAYLLEFYDVEYVYVGSNERSAYTRSDLATFDSMEGITLEEEWGSVRVYRVNQDELNAPEE